MASSIENSNSGVKVTPDNIENKEINNTSNNLVFSRENIESLGNLVSLVDTDDSTKLDMFCYVKCNPNDNDLLKQCRGVVFNGQQCILKAFPYTIEYNHTENAEINTNIVNINEWTFFNSYEGTLLRVFYFGEKWYISTHRKLNAFKSKWASQESFGMAFKNALLRYEEDSQVFRDSLPAGENIIDRFQETLDKKKQYMFLILNTGTNRIVCSPPDKPTVYHVGTFVDGNLVMNETTLIQSPKPIAFNSIDNLLSHVESLSYKDLQGVIGFHTSTNRQLKIVNKRYQELFNVRGNEPSIKFRYIQCRMDSQYVDSLCYLYPDMKPAFEEIETNIYNVAKIIYKAYVDRFIKKSYVTVPKEEFAVIKECHLWYLSNRAENRVSLEKIIRILNNQPATRINHMVRRFKMEKFTEQPPNTQQENNFVRNRQTEFKDSEEQKTPHSRRRQLYVPRPN